MDKFNHWIGKLFLWFNRKTSTEYAVTFGQTTYYSCSTSLVPVWWKVHEDEHKKQYKKDGWAKFLIRYLWQSWTKGYLNIDYEIEARKAALPFGGPKV